MIIEDLNFFTTKNQLSSNFFFFNVITYHITKLNDSNNEIILSKYTEEIFQGEYSNIGIYEKKDNNFIIIDKISRS